VEFRWKPNAPLGQLSHSYIEFRHECVNRMTRYDIKPFARYPILGK